MRKTTLEKITSVEEQIRQLENQRKQLLQQQKAANRKARTKRLIERGAILESLISGADALTNEQIKAFLEKTVQTVLARNILDNMTAAAPDVHATQPTKSAEPPSGADGGRTGETARVPG